MRPRMPYLATNNTLLEAAAWLAAETGEDWPEKKIIDHAIKAEIAVLASVPGWTAPGNGELTLQDSQGNPIPWASDGLVKVNSWVLMTLLNHGRAQLARVPIDVDAKPTIDASVIGGAPFIDISHLRILGTELKQFASLRAGKQTEETPQRRRERIASRCDELKNSGVRDFLQQVAAEEGTSVSNIKKLRTKAKPKAGTIDALRAFGK